MKELQAAWRELRADVDALGAEREQYRELFDGASDAYLLSDADGVIRDVNFAAVDLLRRRRQALRGKPLAALVALEARAPFRAFLGAIRDALSSARTVLDRSGARLAVELSARRVPSGALLIRLRATR